MSEEKKQSQLFKKPVSLLFIVIGLVPFLLFLINTLMGGKSSMLISAFNTLKGNINPFIAIMTVLVVLLALGIFGITFWKKKRLDADVGNKFVPNLYAFIDTLGIWLACWIAISSFFIVLAVKVFDYDAVLSYLGLGKMAGSITWGMAFLGIVRGLLIFIVTKVILFLINARWDIWKFFWQHIVLRFASWLKNTSLQGSRTAFCFIAFVLFVSGVCLIHKGVKSGHFYLVKKLSSAVSIEKISGGKVPDALTGISSQFNPGGTGEGDIQAGVSAKARVNNDDYDFFIEDEFDFSAMENMMSRAGGGADNTERSSRVVRQSVGNSLVYSGLVSILLSLLAMGFLLLKKNQN